MKKCPYCAEEIQDEAILCRYCGRDLTKPVSVQQTEKPARVKLMDEKTIFEDRGVKITNLRAIFFETTYSISNISAVKMEASGSQSACILFLGFGMGLGFLCLAALVFGSNEPRFRDVMIGSGILGLIILGITVRVAGAVKTKYSALISTSSGEIKAYTSDDEVFMKNIVESINQAMAQNR